MLRDWIRLRHCMQNKPAMPGGCDIFCNVIDNYGDIGVCWRLARQLANEHGLAVRLWVDDLASLAKLCPEAEAGLELQHRRGVMVYLWHKEFPDIQPADLVIEAFACKLPENYIDAMASEEQEPVWINLEYLSAEDWVESHHKLPSPHPEFPLTRYFFFPGFTPKTGGLLLERDLLARRNAFQENIDLQQSFWRSIGMEMPAIDTLKVSLFAYENAALDGLFDVWANGDLPVLCLVPEGSILPRVGQYFGDPVPNAGSDYVRGRLHVRVLPFVEQERYDELLWACDVNFVRGEDSFVRALWAGKPLVWQIYRQHDAVHLKKLDAFLILYGKQLDQSASLAVHDLWLAWNVESGAEKAWPAFIAELNEINGRARDWARQLAENNLALNLLDFYREIGRMRALKIEGQ